MSKKQGQRFCVREIFMLEAPRQIALRTLPINLESVGIFVDSRNQLIVCLNLISILNFLHASTLCSFHKLQYAFFFLVNINSQID